jgi:hypothetical protein
MSERIEYDDNGYDIIAVVNKMLKSLEQNNIYIEFEWVGDENCDGYDLLEMRSGKSGYAGCPSIPDCITCPVIKDCKGE